MISAASPGFGARARNEASTAKTETTGGLMGGQFGHGPQTFPIIFPQSLKGQHWHFTKMHSISKFNLPFSRTRRRKRRRRRRILSSN